MFPRRARYKVQELSLNFNLSEISNAKIDKAVKKGQKRAKEMVQKLGMAELFKKHSLWGSKISMLALMVVLTRMMMLLMMMLMMIVMPIVMPIVTVMMRLKMMV